MKKLLVSVLLLLSAVIAGCSSNQQTEKTEKQQVELTVSAAASLQDALNEIKQAFEKEHPTIKVSFNFGGSGSLQQQISQGAPVDIFFSAAEDKFDKLVQEGLIEEKNGIDLVGNDLVLVVPKNPTNKIKGFSDLSKAQKISIGTPETVPAGKYAQETLKNLKLWDKVKGKMVFAKDVRQVLTYVETNNVDAGIVYKTDALISKKVEIVDTADERTHQPIIYPVGMIKSSSHTKEAKVFYDYLQTEPSLKILEKYGFKRLKK